MERISHSEMRNNSARILREVVRGTSMLITNHGQVVAQIGPPATEADHRPKVLAPASTTRRLPTPVTRQRSTAEMLEELRGEG